MLLATRVELTLVMFMLLIVSVISHDKSHSHLPGKGKLHRRVTIQRDDLKMTSRIWNGSRTSYKVHPYFGLLTLRTTKGCYAPACGGVFITPQVFMTAAHCLMKKQMIPTQSMKIRYGIDRAKTTSGNGHQFGKGFDHSVSKSFVHPLYVPTISRFHTRDQVADIGLVTLSEPIKHTSFIARLPEPDEDIPFLWGGEETSFVGAGTSYGQDAKDYLKEAKVVLYPCSHNQDELDAFQTCSKVEGGSVRGCPGTCCFIELEILFRLFFILFMSTQVIQVRLS